MNRGVLYERDPPAATHSFIPLAKTQRNICFMSSRPGTRSRFGTGIFAVVDTAITSTRKES